jgi:uncharacterized protein YuzE
LTSATPEYDESEEIYDGFVVDFDKSGRPMGIEIYYDASKFVDNDRLMKMVPEELTSETEAPLVVQDRNQT